MPRSFKIAVVQMKSRPGEAALNVRRGIEILRESKARGADMVLFPECWITGYEIPISDDSLPLNDVLRLPEYAAWKDRALCDDSEFLKSFCKTAAELKIGIVITAFTQGETRPQNSAFVIGRDGTVLMKYSKVHTCDFSDERLLESGDEFRVCSFDGIRIGIMICYDREYPESARVLMMKGAELILVPNDCSCMPPRLRALSTRAYENMTGVVMANPPGKNAGCSCAYSPIVWDQDGNPVDNTILLADDLTEGVFMAEYDIDKLREYRSEEMMGNTFRKVKAYRELLNPEIHEPFIRR